MTITFKVDDVVPKEMHTIDPTNTHYLQNIRMVEKSGVDTKKTIAESSWDQTVTHSSDNGFVRGVMQAYNQHHNLVLRPDDIWSAITIQFGLHVSKNAETFRHMLVEHEGQKEVCVTADGNILFFIPYTQYIHHIIYFINNTIRNASHGRYGPFIVGGNGETAQRKRQRSRDM
jgi:hypothetical protein